MPAGGIARLRSFQSTFSQNSASALIRERLAGSMTTPPVLSWALWQVVQYRLSAAAAEAAGDCAAAIWTEYIPQTKITPSLARISGPVRMGCARENHSTHCTPAMEYTGRTGGHMNARLAIVMAICAALPGLAADAKRAPLIDAVKAQDAAAVRALLAQGADVNAAEADGSTALHWAAQRDNLEIANLLIAAGANVKAATRYNITPLSLACTNGDAALIGRLIDVGADPNGVSEEGQTALMTASLTGKVEAVKLLLARGAKPNIAEPYKGQTALMWAASEGNAAAEA